jgi:hypothetical protein
MTDGFTPLCGPDLAWVNTTLDLIEQRYVGGAKILVTELNGDGVITDPEPLVADFGDVLPFLQRYGRNDFAREQMLQTGPYLTGGLYRSGGRLKLFSNHDWLLGLLELHRATGDVALLEAARTGSLTIIETMFVGDLLIDEPIVGSDPRTWAARANAFNGGYIELWLELYDLTGDPAFLSASVRLAEGWVATAGFRKYGLFCRVLSAHSDILGALLKPASNLSVLLFKDNTNMVWSLAALEHRTKDGRWKGVIDRWLTGFETLMLNGGDVWLQLDRNMQGREVSLKAAFATIDLLCDLAAEGLSDRSLAVAQVIADRWLTRQWDNGLFPEHPDGDRDHLDANVDMAIALQKLAGLTGRPEYAEAAGRAAQAVPALHATPYGLCLAVGPDGAVVRDKITVKYQALALKLALAPADPKALLADADLMSLLRDR